MTLCARVCRDDAHVRLPFKSAFLPLPQRPRDAVRLAATLQCLATAASGGGGRRRSDVVAVDVTSAAAGDVTWWLLLLLQMVAQILLNAGVVVRTQDFENRTVAARMPAIKSIFVNFGNMMRKNPE